MKAAADTATRHSLRKPRNSRFDDAWYLLKRVSTRVGIVQELCESRGGRPEPSGFRGRNAILNHASALVSACA